MAGSLLPPGGELRQAPRRPTLAVLIQPGQDAEDQVGGGKVCLQEGPAPVRVADQKTVAMGHADRCVHSFTAGQEPRDRIEPALLRGRNQGVHCGWGKIHQDKTRVRRGRRGREELYGTVLRGQESGVSSVCAFQEEPLGKPGFGSEDMNGEGLGALGRAASVRWDTQTSSGVPLDYWLIQFFGPAEMARESADWSSDPNSQVTTQASGTCLEPQPRGGRRQEDCWDLLPPSGEA